MMPMRSLLGDVAGVVEEETKVRYSDAGNLKPSLGLVELVLTVYAVVAHEVVVGSSAEVGGCVQPERPQIQDRGDQHLDRKMIEIPILRSKPNGYSDRCKVVLTWPGDCRLVKRSCWRVRSTELCF